MSRASLDFGLTLLRLNTTDSCESMDAAIQAGFVIGVPSLRGGKDGAHPQAAGYGGIHSRGRWDALSVACVLAFVEATGLLPTLLARLRLH